jgi:hypothetical protein
MTMKKFLLLSALVCAIVGVAASAALGAPLLVTGAGFSAQSGQLVVNARGIGPTPQWSFESTPAVGFLRAPAVPAYPSGTLDLSGRVTCIAGWLPNAVAVSGTLDTPLVYGDFTTRNFSLLIQGSGRAPWLWVTPSILGPSTGAGPCGMTLFFLAGLDLTYQLPEYHLRTGHILIAGIS